MEAKSRCMQKIIDEVCYVVRKQEHLIKYTKLCIGNEWDFRVWKNCDNRNLFKVKPKGGSLQIPNKILLISRCCTTKFVLEFKRESSGHTVWRILNDIIKLKDFKLQKKKF